MPSLKPTLLSAAAALLGANAIIACGEKAADDSGTYYGYYRGPARSNELPTPTGTGPIAATGGSGPTSPMSDAGAMTGAGGGAMNGQGGDDMGSGGGDMGSENPMGDQICDAPATVFTPRCGSAGCHGATGIGNFGVGADEAESYVGEEPSLTSADCGLMIDPDDPSASLLLTKTTGDFPSGASCGGIMPLGGGALSATETDCIESWLSQF